MGRFALLAALLLFAGCSHAPNAYEMASPRARARFRHVSLPLPPGGSFHLSQGAFGSDSHHDRGLEYRWDFDVPYGTPVVSVDDGVVYQVWQPNLGGGCDPKFSDTANNVKILHADGTVAQYVHVRSWVLAGQAVKRGQVIAVTANNGFHCTPQLCFSVFKSKDRLFGSASPRTVPLQFDSVPGGLLVAGTDYRVPEEGIGGALPDQLRQALKTLPQEQKSAGRPKKH